VQLTQLFEGDAAISLALEFGMLSETLDQLLGEVAAWNAKLLSGIDDVSVVGEEVWLVLVVLRSLV
jgi:hypothetical protein